MEQVCGQEREKEFGVQWKWLCRFLQEYMHMVKFIDTPKLVDPLCLVIK